MGSPDQSSDKEIKTVMSPKAFSQFVFRSFGGNFFVRTGSPLAELENREFSTGSEGKREKLEAAKEGLVIVQRGIVTTLRERARKILVSERLAENHVVTGGGSIMVSGDASLSAQDILVKKLRMEEQPAETDYSLLGYGFSDPEKTGGIMYLFEVHRLALQKAMKIEAPAGKDPVSFMTLGRAKSRISEKPLELNVLEEIRKAG